MRPTRLRLLVALAVAGAAVVLVAVALLRPTLPVVPWTLPVTLAVVAAGVWVAALSFRRRLRGAPGARPYDPLHAARMVVLAKACSHGGALLTGLYLGLAISLVLRSSSALRRLDAGLAGLTALAALLLVTVGLALERFCRVPPPEDSTGPQPPTAPA